MRYTLDMMYNLKGTNMNKKEIIRDGEVVAVVEQKLNTTRMWKLGESITERISIASTNKIDKNDWTISGLSGEGEKIIRRAMKRSKFSELKKRVGRDLSKKGLKAVAMINDGDEIYFKDYDVIDFKEKFYEYTYVVLETGENELWTDPDGFPYNFPVYMEYSKSDKGIVTRESWYYNHKTKERVATGKFTYPKSVVRIPVEIIKNNENGLSDIGNSKMWDAIKELDWIATEGQIEWAVTRAMWTDRELFSNEDLETIINENRRIIKRKGTKSKLQEPSEPISLGSQSVLIAHQAINFIERKILEYTFTSLKPDQSGTNKFNKEISMFNQDATEYIDSKREQREVDYTRLVENFCMFYNAIVSKKYSEETIEGIQVQINLSQLEKSIIEQAEGKEDPQEPQEPSNDKNDDSEGDE